MRAFSPGGNRCVSRNDDIRTLSAEEVCSHQPRTHSESSRSPDTLIPFDTPAVRHPRTSKNLSEARHGRAARDAKPVLIANANASTVGKLELANAARDAGARAELEARGPDGKWRADVLATDRNGGAWSTALEAQLAPITDVDITARTEKMRADGVTSIWFSDRPSPPWLGTVPSVRLSRPNGEEHLIVAEGLVKFEGRGWSPVTTSLSQFLAWVFARRVVPHVPRTLLGCRQRALVTVWTTPQCIRAEDAYLLEEERRRRTDEARMAELEKARVATRAKDAAARAKALAEAAAVEQTARTHQAGAWRREMALHFRRGIDEALTKLAEEHGITATAGYSTGDPRYAGGVPLVDEEGVPVAVFDPDPKRVRADAFCLMTELLLLFPNKASQRYFNDARNIKKEYRPIGGYRTDAVKIAPTSPAMPPRS
ncbi:competence protein CoiA [Streptomyces sp. CA-106110]|uniref:competence protein CoiA family protein n=1 Tax=Streptomyces sp. CA-106110 TaxID=3240044 RepID=UPI003D90420F